MNSLNSFFCRLAVALLVALLALAVPHAANAQPILRGKMQRETVSVVSAWQPVSNAIVAPGQVALPAWSGVAATRPALPTFTVEVAPAPLSSSAPVEALPLPGLSWLNLLIP